MRSTYLVTVTSKQLCSDDVWPEVSGTFLNQLTGVLTARVGEFVTQKFDACHSEVEVHYKGSVGCSIVFDIDAESEVTLNKANLSKVLCEALESKVKVEKRKLD